MKRSLGIVLALIGTTLPTLADNGSCDCKTESHTFFSVRPQYQSASPERVSLFRGEQTDLRDNGWGGAVQLAFFGGRSTRRDELACFFTPFGKEQLSVKETPDATTDIDARNFNVRTANGNFASTISFAPRQTIFGLGMTYRQNLNTLMDWNCDDRTWWFEISSPLTHVKNRMHLEENVINNGGVVLPAPTGLPATQVLVPNMEAAFKQAAWNFGKIDKSTKNDSRTTRLADIELKVGYEWLNQECCGIESFLGVLIPTDNRVRSEYVFEAIVGHNKHWGIMSGTSAHFDIWDNNCWNLNFCIDMSSKYLFSRTETRSFDLKGKPWSRYLEVYANIAQANAAAALALAGNTEAALLLSTPGINIFTQDMKIKPRFSHTMNLALVAKNSSWQAELGYNMFVRQAECAKLKNAWQEVAAIKAATGLGATNKFRLINAPLDPMVTAPANYNDNIIKASDLDLESATHPCILSHNFYGAAGYRWDDMCYPIFIGIGGSYEFAQDNATLSRFLGWGKFGISF
jgi:hypothetical protein